jgi:hypothetical protein
MHPDMFRRTEPRFADYFKKQPETGVGCWIATAHLKDGRVFSPVLVASGCVTEGRGFLCVPFGETDVKLFVVTHDKSRE